MSKAILAKKTKTDFAKGDVVFKENTSGEEMYIIKSGKVEIVKKVEGQEVVLATLGEKSFFGEMALFGDPSRSATVRAAEDTEMIVITKPMLDSQLANVPEWFVSMLKHFVGRLREVNKSLKSRFAYGMDFSLLKCVTMLMSKSGKESDKGVEFSYDEAVEYLQSFMGVSKADVEDKLKQYSFLNIVKISVRENILYMPDKKRVKKFIDFLRGEGYGGKDATTEYKKVKSDDNIYGYFKKLYKLLSR